MSTRWLAAAVTAALLLLTASTDAADKEVVRLWQTETEPQTMAVLNQIAWGQVSQSDTKRGG